MAILADKQIRKMVEKKELIIDPFFPDLLGPNLYYCHLGNKFLRPKSGVSVFDPLTMESKNIFEEIKTDEAIVLEPQGFILAETFEFLGVDSKHIVKLMNSSSLARCGVSHAAVGMINAGCGMKKPIKLTLELVNNSPFGVVLTPTVVREDGKINWGTEVLKIAVMTMDEEPENAYDNWKHAVYNVDQKPSGSKMKGRFDSNKFFIIPDDSWFLKD